MKYRDLIDSYKKYVNDEEDTYKINGFCLKHELPQIFDYLDEDDAIEVNW